MCAVSLTEIERENCWVVYMGQHLTSPSVLFGLNPDAIPVLPSPRPSAYNPFPNLFQPHYLDFLRFSSRVEP